VDNGVHPFETPFTVTMISTLAPGVLRRSSSKVTSTELALPSQSVGAVRETEACASKDFPPSNATVRRSNPMVRVPG